MEEILKPFHSLEKTLATEVGGLRADILSRMAELEMRVTTALLDTVRSTQELSAELRQQPPQL